jgi:uncharacterized membrane protein
MTEDLPPLFARYGTQLRIAGVDVTTNGGQALYQAAVRTFALPAERLGVPALVVGTRVLVGDVEIPSAFPGIVARGLAAGGIDWPAVPEVRQALALAGVPVTPARDSAAAVRAADSAAAAARAVAESTPAAAAPQHADTQSVSRRDSASAKPTPRAIAAAPHGNRLTAPAAAPRPPAPAPAAGSTPGVAQAPGRAGALTPLAGAARRSSATAHTVWDRFLRDPVGNGAAVAVMLAMAAALTAVAASVLGRARLPAAPMWVVPALALLGLGVAAYLSFVEVSGVRAVCGPVGDCNTVQQSEYARLFGVLPVGVAGLAGYAAIIAAWLLATLGRGNAGRAGRLAAWGIALGATLFSIYLTFLEPFVIGATCSWCLTSAVISTLLCVTTTPTAEPDLRGLLPHLHASR